MKIEVLLTEAEIAREFAEAVEARDLPEKFLYWTPLSVETWKGCASETDESLESTWKALTLRAADLVKPFPGRVPVISLGSGAAARDLLLLKALSDAGREVAYFPVDSSQNLLETACAAAEDQDCETLGIKADISSPMHLMLAADVSEAPRLFLMVGDTLGGFDPVDQISHLASRLHKGDLLILDARIHGQSEEHSAAERTFTLAPLAALGITPHDGELKFAASEDDRHPGLHLMVRRFQAGRDLQLQVFGRDVHIARGERIFLNFSYRFTREALRWLVSDHGGLRIVGEIPSADGKFVTLIVAK